MSAPFIISKPQFLDADEKLLQNVDGLRPNREEHDIFLHLEMVRPKTALSLTGLTDGTPILSF